MRSTAASQSRGARRLSGLLTLHTGIEVHVTYRGGWCVQWCDGPTVNAMRDLTTRLVGRHGINIPIRSHTRGSTDVAELRALLTQLQARRRIREQDR